nr:hypothetical protein [uncultured Hyphomonas sp.]
MAHKRDPQIRSKGDGDLLAYGISGLILSFILPQVLKLSHWIFNTFLWEDFYDAEYLYIPIFLLCLVVCFFGGAFLLRFGPRLLLLVFLVRK